LRRDASPSLGLGSYAGFTQLEAGHLRQNKIDDASESFT
jgi:hypothetical protein